MDRRISEATRLLEQSMGERPDYTQIAAAVGLSLHRFHHLFADETGETPGDYLRRIRLDVAAARLRWTRDTVGHVAANLGYASQSSFNKAFERRFGITPIGFRRDREIWPPDPTDSVADKRVRLTESEGFRLLARRYVGAPCYVPDYWADFLGDLPRGLEKQERHLFVGLLRDDMRFTPPEQVRYDCCVTVSAAYDAEEIAELWPGLSLISVPAGRCATMNYRGYYASMDAPDRNQSISHAYSHLLDHWLTESRHTFTGEYAVEVYATPHSRCDKASLECTILAQVG